jgi:hypothetical protein
MRTEMWFDIAQEQCYSLQGVYTEKKGKLIVERRQQSVLGKLLGTLSGFEALEPVLRQRVTLAACLLFPTCCRSCFIERVCILRAAAGVIPCRHQPGRNVAQGCVTAAVETVRRGSCAAGVLCVSRRKGCVTPDYQRVTRRPPRSVLDVHAASAHQDASRRHIFNIVQMLFRFTCTASHSSHTIPSTPPPTPPERAQTSTQLHRPCHAHSATPCIAEHWIEDLAVDSLRSGELKRERTKEGAAPMFATHATWALSACGASFIQEHAKRVCKTNDGRAICDEEQPCRQ